MRTNHGKTAVVRFGPDDGKPIPKFNIEGIPDLLVKDSYEYLGVTLQSDLSTSIHANRKCGSLHSGRAKCQAMGAVWGKHTPLDSAAAWNTFGQSRIQYALGLWGHLPAASKN
jgi:hypothetical protein